MKIPSITVVALISIIFMSCAPSPTEIIWKLEQYPKIKRENRQKIASALLNDLKFLQFGSEDEKTIRLVGTYTGIERQGITIWIRDGVVIIFAAREMNDGMERDFAHILSSIEKLITSRDCRVSVTSDIPTGIYIQ